MNQLKHQKQRAFTLVELAVVLAMIAVLGTMLLPALASTRSQSNRAQCANNLRQLGVGYNIYAQDFSGWYPLTHAGANPLNVINGGFYTRSIFVNSAYLGQHLTFSSGTPSSWTDFGSLYPQRLVGDGRIFYCPDLTDKRTPLGASFYEPLLTADLSGTVRGSYLVNFHNGTGLAPDGVVRANVRTYQKNTDVRSRVVFGMDYVDSTHMDTSGNVLTDSINFAHSQARGWNVMFSDASVNFIRIPVREMKLLRAGLYATGVSAWNSQNDAAQINTFATLLETNSP